MGGRGGAGITKRLFGPRGYRGLTVCMHYSLHAYIAVRLHDSPCMPLHAGHIVRCRSKYKFLRSPALPFPQERCCTTGPEGVMTPPCL